MKKTLIALAALAATSAFAQSTVTLYGRLDLGYAQNTTTATAAGVSAETRNNGINNDGLSTSLWGLKGSEDLGGGLKANFQLEQGIALDSGAMGTTTGANLAAASVGFNRISTLGLSGNFGEVKLGRDYTPLFSTIGSADIFGTTGATTVNLFPDGVRASDMISYATPNMSGFSAKVMLGRNDTGTTAAAAKSGNTGLSVSYAAGPLMVGAAVGKIDTTVGVVEGKNDGAAVVASYNLGAAKLFGGYTRAKVQANNAVDSYVNATETNLGVAVPMGAATFLLAYGRNTGRTVATGVETANVSGNDVVLGVTYDLSKRTSLYAKTGTYNKADGSAAGVNVATKTNTTALGVRHTF